MSFFYSTHQWLFNLLEPFFGCLVRLERLSDIFWRKSTCQERFKSFADPFENRTRQRHRFRGKTRWCWSLSWIFTVCVSCKDICITQLPSWLNFPTAYTTQHNAPHGLKQTDSMQSNVAIHIRSDHIVRQTTLIVSYDEKIIYYDDKLQFF